MDTIRDLQNDVDECVQKLRIAISAAERAGYVVELVSTFPTKRGADGHIPILGWSFRVKEPSAPHHP